MTRHNLGQQSDRWARDVDARIAALRSDGQDTRRFDGVRFTRDSLSVPMVTKMVMGLTAATYAPSYAFVSTVPKGAVRAYIAGVSVTPTELSGPYYDGAPLDISWIFHAGKYVEDEYVMLGWLMPDARFSFYPTPGQTIDVSGLNDLYIRARCDSDTNAEYFYGVELTCMVVWIFEGVRAWGQ